MHTGFQTRPLGRPRHRKIILKSILEESDGVLWTGLIRHRIRTTGGLFWIRYRTFGFHKILRNSRVTAICGLSKSTLLRGVGCIQKFSPQLTYMFTLYSQMHCQMKLGGRVSPCKLGVAKSTAISTVHFEESELPPHPVPCKCSDLRTQIMTRHKTHTPVSTLQL
jgi:hypothetical protein